MPCMVTTGIYPPDKEKEVWDIYNEGMEKIPVDESISVPLGIGVNATVNGIEVIAMSEIKPGKLEIALERMKRFMAMLHSIPGFRYEIKVYMTTDEHLKSIGMG